MQSSAVCREAERNVKVRAAFDAPRLNEKQDWTVALQDAPTQTCEVR